MGSTRLASFVLALAPVLGAQDPVVEVTGGKVHGEVLTVSGQPVRAFRGIPFAAPPVGERRWRRPQPVEPWEGERACRRFAPACPQPDDLAYGFTFRDQAEDCLYLNVWTSAADATARLPVMVWIHGGGNLIGGASAPFYDGRHLAASGVVLVSIQYRLGVFGWLAHPALSAEASEADGRAASGNYGLLDQIAALRWVQANIERFGGDPGCVTIFGESAGGANVTYLMASPLAAGLFHRAIAQSGWFGGQTPWLDDDRGLLRSAHRTGLDLAQRLDVGASGAETLAALRALSVERLLSVPVSIGSMVGGGRGGRPLRFGPNVDGWVLPRQPLDVWTEGKMHRVPLLAGSLLDDGSVFSSKSPIRGVTGYELAVRAVFGSDSERALALFPVADHAAVPAAVHQLTTLLAFRAPARRLARWMEAAGGEAWLYHFSHLPARRLTSRQGVFHGVEVPFVFGTLGPLASQRDLQVSADLLRRWVTFARHGDPNGPEGSEAVTPRWPKHSKDSDLHLEIRDPTTVGSGLDHEACDLLDAAAARRGR